MLRISVRALLTAATLAGLLAPASAAAAVKHVAPTGSGTTCTVAAPCALYPALGAAVNGDEVVVSPGDYGSVTTPLSDDGEFGQSNLYVHGVAGQPRPRIFTTYYYPFAFSGDGVRLEHLQLEGLGNGGSVQYALRLSGAGGSVADDIVAHVRSADGDVACSIGGTATIRNSVCWDSGSGTNGKAFFQFAALGGPIDGTVRNSTLISDHATAVQNDSSNGGGGGSRPATLRLVNSIVRGGQYDIYQQQSAPAAATVTTTRVNRRGPAGVVNAGGATLTADPMDQFTPPIFVGAATGDFGQAPGSPTVDAGLTDAANGPSALGGSVPRRVGTATDIGADELTTAPSLISGTATASAPSTAELQGTINPNGAITALRAQYGTTTAYGALTPESTIEVGAAAVPVSAALTGLAPSTTYHVRLVATNAKGTSTGEDRTFTTPAAAGPVGVRPPPAIVPPSISSLSVSPRTLRAGRAARLSLRLNAAATVRITLLRGVAGRRKGASCVRKTVSNRRAKRCVRYVTGRSLSRTLAPGLVRVALPTTFLGRRAGRYRLQVVAEAGGRRSAVARVSLRIVRG